MMFNSFMILLVRHCCVINAWSTPFAQSQTMFKYSNDSIVHPFFVPSPRIKYHLKTTSLKYSDGKIEDDAKGYVPNDRSIKGAWDLNYAKDLFHLMRPSNFPGVILFHVSSIFAIVNKITPIKIQH